MKPNKIDNAIQVLVENAPPEGYYGRDSGGKDSSVIIHLARAAGVKVRWSHSLTTLDPPEVVRFIKRHHPKTEIIRPAQSLLRRMIEKGVVPNRRMRWCCDEYKERRPPKGAVVLTGIRGEESPSREKNWDFRTWNKRARRWFIQPIYDWTEADVWRLIKAGIPYCSLYDEDFARLGCIGCPLRGDKRAEFRRWPKHRLMWEKALRDLWGRKEALAADGAEPWIMLDRWGAFENFWAAFLRGEENRKNPRYGLVNRAMMERETQDKEN
jgi:phosphoadenosine phosphosulfate reductase